jgi:DNA polymerase-3 subunit delta
MAKKPDSLVVRETIDRGAPPPVWLWTGPEEFLKDELFARLTARLVDPGMEKLNVDRFKAGEDPVETVLGTAVTLPMLGARRVVLVRDVEGFDRGEREALVRGVERASPETALVLTGSRGPRDPLYTKLVKAGAVPAVFWMPFEDQILVWIRLRFKDLGKDCSPETALALLEACGGGGGRQVALGDIAPEIEKVALAAGDRDAGAGDLSAILPDDLRVIARKANETLLYEICTRIDAGDFPGAVRALDGALLFKDNTEVRVVATLALHVGRLAWVRDLLDSGMPPGAVQQTAGVWPRQWPQVERAARRLSAEALHGGLRALADADRSLKSSAKDPRVVLERALAAVCA